MPDAPDTTKLEELYLYVAAKARSDGHPGLGRIRVAKLLFLSDFGAYARFGESITGAQYWADEMGPAPVDELLVTRDLESRGDLRWDDGYERQRIPVPLRPARVELFQPHQLAYVDQWLDKCRFFTAAELVDIAHEFPGWRFAWEHEGTNASIPYEAVFWSRRATVSSSEEAHARQLAEEFSLPQV
jgi:Protein of unknown function (DUF4065)